VDWTGMTRCTELLVAGWCLEPRYQLQHSSAKPEVKWAFAIGPIKSRALLARTRRSSMGFFMCPLFLNGLGSDGKEKQFDGPSSLTHLPSDFQHCSRQKRKEALHCLTRLARNKRKFLIVNHSV
jgi:hypothetical protein